MSGQNSSSKTVAAILKQHQDLVAAREMATNQQMAQQSQPHRKKPKPKTVHKQQGNMVSHNSHVPSAKSRVAGGGISSSHPTSLSQTLNHTTLSQSQLGDMFATKESKPAATTKASSLSRELSPSSLTAQMKKVMPDPSAQANLLLNALQGNMPNPMSIFTSKPDSLMLSPVSELHNASADWSTSTQLSSSDSQLTSAVFTNSFTPVTIFTTDHLSDHLSESLTDSVSTISPNNRQQVENLVAQSLGNIQTINVSHVPKNSIPTSSKNVTPSSGESAAGNSRSAMEVAQQIRMEANGQSASAMRVQQQLRTQIQGSRSIDAQLTGLGKCSSSKTPAPRHEKDQKSLEVSMPLLAAKLAPSTLPGPTATSQRAPTFSKVSNSAELGQSQQSQLGQSQLSLLVMSQISTAGSPSVMTSGIMSKSSAKSPHYMNASDSTQLDEAKRQMQQNRLSSSPRSQMMYGQDGGVALLSDVNTSGISVSSAADQMWALGHGQTDKPSQQVSTMNFDMQMKGARNKHQTMTSTASDILSLGQSKPVLQSRVEYGGGQPKLNWNTSLTVRAHLDQRKTPPDKRAKTDLEDQRTLSLSSPHGLLALQRHMAGDSKQTAIDVDLSVSVGQLTSIVSDETPALIAKNTSGAATATHKVHSNLSNASIKDSNFQPATAMNQTHQTPHVMQAGFLGKTMTKSSTNSYSNSNPPMPITMSIADISVSKPGEVKPSTLPSQHTVSGSALSAKYSVPTNALSRPANSAAMISAAQVSSSAPRASYSHSGVPTSKQPPSYESLPPPYPHPSPIYSLDHNSRLSNVNKKESNHNPFTFPTSGLTHTSDSGGLSSQVNHDAFSSKPSSKPPPAWHANSSLSRTHSDVVCSQKHTAISSSDLASRLAPPTIKLEGVGSAITNHVSEVEITSDEPTAISPFNQRISNLSCFPVMNSTYRAAYRSHAVAVQKARAGVIMSTAKSLDILRQNLQHGMNREITQIIKKYTEKYFQPALENIRLNNNEGALGDEHINYVCRQILEEAKCEYMPMAGQRSATPSDIADNMSESGSTSGRRLYLKRSRVSDSDSERGSDSGFKRKAVKRKGRPLGHTSGRVTPSKPYKSAEVVKREGPKWDPVRLKTDTLFVMGARANKALGLGNTRGRLYIRHPDVFKYIGDQEDKLWLYDHNLMPATGGKAYMLLLEDIEELSRSDDYKDSPGLMMHECVGFTVPEWMLVKMKEQMASLRSDKMESSTTPPPSTGEDQTHKILPFSSFSEIIAVKEEVQLSPADTEEMDFLSVEQDDNQPSAAVSPFADTGGFQDQQSPPELHTNMEELSSQQPNFLI